MATVKTYIGNVKGKDGKSAYQIALDNGFVGTEQQWLNSLKEAESAQKDGDGNIIAETYAKKSNVLSSVAECTASTNDEDIAGASAISELQESKSDKTIYGDNFISLGRKNNTTVASKSIAFGYNNTASGANSVAFGSNNTASGNYSHVEGSNNTASGESSHAEGQQNTSSGRWSHAEGNVTTASGLCSHAEGSKTKASEKNAHAEGIGTVALKNQHAQGHYNNTTLSASNSESGTSTGTAFVIGNGTEGSLSNAFRVTGEGVTYAKGNYNSTGADYAEYFEWQDGNAYNEDRVGYFVTFADGKNIKKASEGDYILGIVSGMPCVIGNSDECWQKQFEMDDFGRFIYENQKYIDPETGEEKECTFYKVNPDYDPTKPYEHREQRPEWSAVGIVGVLSVYDDGTCQVNGYCKCADGGIATACERGVDTFRVIERVKDNIVKVVLK